MRIQLGFAIVCIACSLWAQAPDFPAKDSHTFLYKYEAQNAAPAQENPGEWNASALAPIVSGCEDGVITASFSMNRYWSLPAAMLAQLDPARGWTLEVRLRIDEQTGSKGAMALAVDDEPGQPGAVNGLQIFNDKTQFCVDGAIADASDNNDGFHTFRIAEGPSSRTVHAWRDNRYLGSASHSASLTNLPHFLLIGSWLSRIAGKVEIDYIRWDSRGPFSPAPSLLEVTATSGATWVREDIAVPDTLQVRLTQPPAAPVVVHVTPGIGQSRSNDIDLGAGPGMPVQVTFTPENASQYQQVIINAVDDTIREWQQVHVLRFSAISRDPLFDGQDVLMNVHIADDDSVLALRESGDKSEVFEQAATEDDYEIFLGVQPFQQVNVAIHFDPRRLRIHNSSVSPVLLTFSPEDWQAAKTVTIQAFDNNDMDLLIDSMIRHTVSSADPVYDGAALREVRVRIHENDVLHAQPDRFTIPLINLDQADRQVVVDRRPGQYLGHPTTVLLQDSTTLLTVYPMGHGRGAIQYKRSTDGGLTWSPPLPTPPNWTTSQEVPTLFRMTDPQGVERLILFSGLYPARRAYSEDNGATWSELEQVGDWGGIVVLGCATRLKDGRYMALFHDDGRFFTANGKVNGLFTVYKIYSSDGGLTWSFPETIISCDWAQPCEPGIFRSPDGNQLLILLRENSRRFTSLFITSDDEGETWSPMRELPAALTGDRHTGQYTHDGRLFISFRDMAKESPTWGDWVGWLGTYEDIIQGREGEYRLLLKDNTYSADCAYPGVEVLPNGMIVTTTYGHWVTGEEPFIVSTRFKPEECTWKSAPLQPGPCKLIAFGSSITAPRKVNGEDLKVYADHLAADLPKAGFRATVHNKSVDGNSSADAMSRFDQDVLSENPDVVILEFGMADAEAEVWQTPPVLTPRIDLPTFRSHIVSMVQRLKSRNIRVLLMAPNPLSWTPETIARCGQPVAGSPYDPADPFGLNALLSGYVTALQEIAIAEQVQFVNVYNRFMSHANTAGQTLDDLLLDGLHPNARGQRMISEALYEVLGISVPKGQAPPDSLPVKSSTLFRYRYEADQAAPHVENGEEWMIPLAAPEVVEVKDGVLVLELGQDQLYRARDAALAELDAAVGWSVEARLRVETQSGSRGAVCLAVDDVAGAGGGLYGLQIHAGRTQWSIDGPDAAAGRNDDDFHVFRLCKPAAGDSVYAYRDGRYLGSRRHPFSFSQPALSKYVLFGSWSAAISGTVHIDYVRWDPSGAFRPDTVQTGVYGLAAPRLGFGLLPNYPNPFNPDTRIVFELPAAARAELEIYDLQGRRVVHLTDQWFAAGEHEVSWNGRDETETPVAAGIYWARLRSGDLSSIQRMLLLR